MADELLNVLRANLANSEAAGLTDKVKRIKVRIAQIEKGPAPKVSTAILTDTPVDPPQVLGVPKVVKEGPSEGYKLRKK